MLVRGHVGTPVNIEGKQNLIQQNYPDERMGKIAQRISHRHTEQDIKQE